MSRLRAILAGMLALLAPLASAQTSTSDLAQQVTCPSSSVFGGAILTKVCTSCFFPIRIGAATPQMPLGGAAPVCTCPGRLFGYPTTGPTLGMWMPGHLVEVVRSPFCSPSLGGELPIGGSGAGRALAALRLQGGPAVHKPSVSGELVYYNMHYFSFPVSQLLSTVTDAVCVANTGADMAVLYLSELDPTWNNDALALQLNPQAALFNNPAGLAACLADAAAATTYQPIPELMWCAGAWGTIYPPSGHAPADTSTQGSASLVATKGMALVHQRGMGLLTYTDAAVCRDIPVPVLPRNQYKLQTMHPIPELVSNHWIGASTFIWGEHRRIPAVGEDFVYLVWNWQECCANP